MNEIIGIIFLSVGVIFDFFGCVGLYRLPDIYNRLQASTKCVTLGTGFILLGVVLISGMGAIAVKAALCLIFIFLTSPTAAHALARGAHKAGVKLWPKSVCDHYREDGEQGARSGEPGE